MIIDKNVLQNYYNALFNKIIMQSYKKKLIYNTK